MNVQTRLERVERSVKALREKVSQDSPCLEILSHLSGIRSAIDKLAAEVALSHLETSISKLVGRDLVARQWHKSDAQSPDPEQLLLDELGRVVTQLIT